MANKQAELLPLLYASEEHYGWSVGMRAITHALLGRIPLPEGPILELGCGGGAFLRELSCMQTSRATVGVDLHPAALTAAQKRLGTVGSLVHANMRMLPFASASFGTVIALDSFDQQGVELPFALAESHRVLCTGGLLLLRVSANEWLRGEHDAAFNTGRRYAKGELCAALERSGFRTVLATYANAILLAPVGMIRVLQRYKLLPFMASSYSSARYDRLLSSILQLEARWIERHKIPFGISLYILAQKVDFAPIPKAF